MSGIRLETKTIASIRRFIDENTSRDGLKQLILEAGAERERILPIPVTSDMRSRSYLSKSDLMNRMFDTVYEDFDEVEADGILLEMVRLVCTQRRSGIGRDSIGALERGLAESGLSLHLLIGDPATRAHLEGAKEETSRSTLDEATGLIAKALRRRHTDPAGSVTACVTAAESVCREAMVRLGLRLPAKKQLPDYLVELRRRSNLEQIGSLDSEAAVRVLSSLSSLAQNVYRAAHDVGDRHAHGDDAPPPAELTIDLLIMTSATLAIVISGALRRGDLRVKTTGKGAGA